MRTLLIRGASRSWTRAPAAQWTTFRAIHTSGTVLRPNTVLCSRIADNGFVSCRRPPSTALISLRRSSAMTLPKLDKVRISLHDGVALIKYDIPQANALSPPVALDLIQAFTWALKDSQAKVVVLTGEGNFFTAGLNLTDVPAEGPVLTDEMIGLLGDLHKIWINAEKVIIAAINGPAVGYGTSSIALFDLVYSVPDAFFYVPFIKVGLCAEACSSVTFRKAMGRQKASALVLAGERMTPQELESAGLVTKILPKENFLDEVMKIATRIAASPPGALRDNKILLMDGLREELLAVNEKECAMLKLRAATDEPRQAIENFAREQAEKKKKASKL